MKSVLKEIGSPYTEAQGSQIILNNREVSKYRPELSWDYIAAKKLNRLLEVRKSEVTLAKQLNEEGKYGFYRKFTQSPQRTK